MRVEYLSCDCCGAPISSSKDAGLESPRWVSVYIRNGPQHECISTESSNLISSLRIHRPISDTCPKCREEINDIVFAAVTKIRAVGKTRCLPPETINGC